LTIEHVEVLIWSRRSNLDRVEILKEVILERFDCKLRFQISLAIKLSRLNKACPIKALGCNQNAVSRNLLTILKEDEVAYFNMLTSDQVCFHALAFGDHLAV
jgi:hypothetical protein